MSGGSLTSYVFINFPDIKTVDGYTSQDEKNPLYALIPVVTIRYECKCCSMTIIPL
jgi:hypothetical protein